jgi:hypothetical protein
MLQKEERLRYLLFKCFFGRNCWLQIGVIVSDMTKAYKSNESHQKDAQSPLCDGDHHNYVPVHLVREKLMVIQ